MGRRFRWTVLALVVVLVTGIVILVITVRPGLQDDAQEVRRSWKPLLQPLATRYGTLGGVVGALDNAGNGDRDVTRELRRTLDDWDLLRSTCSAPPRGWAVKRSTYIEAFRASAATCRGSDRLKAVVGLNKAIAALDKATIPPRLVGYNDAVLRYERNRRTLRNIVATLDGYEAHPRCS
jgi:hypothetical protein